MSEYPTFNIYNQQLDDLEDLVDFMVNQAIEEAAPVVYCSIGLMPRIECELFSKGLRQITAMANKTLNSIDRRGRDVSFYTHTINVFVDSDWVSEVYLVLK